MKTTIQAIETQYAGCRFRSRLEARWAVFFDHLGLQWEYEAQGYETRAGRYLPDFWLPEIKMWAEVKGHMEPKDMAKILGAVPDLREARSGQYEPRLIVLGPVPAPGIAWCHSMLSFLQPTHILLNNVFWRFYGEGYYPEPIAGPIHFSTDLDWVQSSRPEDRFFEDFVTTSHTHERLTIDPDVDDAYRAARSARFEFGERG